MLMIFLVVQWLLNLITNKKTERDKKPRTLLNHQIRCKFTSSSRYQLVVGHKQLHFLFALLLTSYQRLA